MRRRRFLGVLAGVAAWPLAARAQQPERVRKIGVGMAYKETDPNGQLQVETFREELRKLGWVEGRNLQIDFRYAADDPARVRALAVELLGRRQDLMVSNSNLVTSILQRPHRGLIIAPNVVNFANSAHLVALAARYRLPAIYPFAFYVRQGGLISYGFDALDQFRQGAGYVDKILRGARPAEPPVQHPTKFDTVINVKPAKALHLTVSAQLQQLATELIEQ